MVFLCKLSMQTGWISLSKVISTEKLFFAYISPGILGDKQYFLHLAMLQGVFGKNSVRISECAFKRLIMPCSLGIVKTCVVILDDLAKYEICQTKR